MLTPATVIAQDLRTDLSKTKQWLEIIRSDLEMADEKAAFLEDQLKAKEAQASALKTQLRELENQLWDLGPEPERSVPSPAPKPAPAPKPKPAPTEDDSIYEEEENRLIESCATRLVMLAGSNGPLGPGFFAQQEGVIRIYTSAAMISRVRHISVIGLDGTKHPINDKLSCPDGVHVAGLHPTGTELPHFEFAAKTETPKVGDRVVVALVNPDTYKVTGIGGAIRGIGPDKWELDADLIPGMSGAPVLSLKSGKLIGIVTPQVAGVAADWALGTRHEESRSFAARLDHTEKWKSIDRIGFAKEAAHVERINERTRIAWAAHWLMERTSFRGVLTRPNPPTKPASPRNPSADANRIYQENYQAWENYKRKRDRWDRVNELAKTHANNVHIRRAQSIISKVTKEDNNRETEIRNNYTSMRNDLKIRDHAASSQYTWHHTQLYKEAIEFREEALRVINIRANRFGR